HFERGGRTNLVAISFSALDKVGHDYGPNSHEIQDILIRLDRTLAELFAGFDRLVGPGNWVVALSADHGVAPIPERAKQEALPAGRIESAAIARTVNEVLSTAFGTGTYVAAYVHDEVYLTPGTYEKMRHMSG